MTTYTVYTTYALISTGNTTIFNSAIHCNYINTMQITTDNISIQEVKINFSDVNNFKFLSDDINTGTGYTAHRIYAIVQLIQNSGTTIPKPNSNNWKYLDITNQVTGYTGAGFLTKNQLVSVIFKIPLNNYSGYQQYDLSYLNYPAVNSVNDLCLGDETYFFGNVTTDIKADVYTTDLSINLPLNQFNSTNNLSWDGESKVSITEVGLYDSNKNLVAIGKFNDPVEKDATISRTILFAIDF